MNELLTQISEELRKTSSGFIGERVDKSTLAFLSDSYSKCVSDMGGTVVKCGLAWNVMSLREKVLWWVSTVVFPSIAKELKKFMPEGKPTWLLEDPHSTILAEAKFVPTIPAKFISVGLTVSKEDSCL